MLVDDLGQTNRPAASRMPEVEDDGSDGGAGLLAGCSSMERVRASRRSLWTHRQGEGWSVAKVAANGGDGHARWSRGRETEEGREDGSERLGSGTRVASPEKARASRKHAGREEVACAWPAGGEHAPLSYCPRWKTTGGSGGGLGRQGARWAAPGEYCSLLFFFYCSCFLLFFSL